MNKIEKFSTITIAIIGAISGIWGAYTAYDASKFKQPFDEHSQIANSFQSQINSAEKRKYKNEINRVRVAYEKFEEDWRSARKITDLVAPIETLATATLDKKQVSELKSLLVSASNMNELSVPPRTLGSAYLAVGNYEDAVKQLKIASAKADDPNALVLQSVALGQLAKNAQTEGLKMDFKNSAANSFQAAIDSPSVKIGKISNFVKGNAELRALIKEKNIKLTNKSSGPADAGR